MESDYNAEIRKLMCEELGTLYHMEGLLLRSLPRFSASTNAPELKKWFQEQVKATRQQMTRLEKVFKICGKETREKKCDSMLSLMLEAKRAMERWKNSLALDAAILCLVQKAVHQQLIGYESLCTWAEILEEREIRGLLGVSLKEEQEAAKELGKLTPRALCIDPVET